MALLSIIQGLDYGALLLGLPKSNIIYITYLIVHVDAVNLGYSDLCACNIRLCCFKACQECGQKHLSGNYCYLVNNTILLVLRGIID